MKKKHKFIHIPPNKQCPVCRKIMNIILTPDNKIDYKCGICGFEPISKIRK